MRHVNLSRKSDSFLITKPASFLINLLVLSITVHGRLGYEHIFPPHSSLLSLFSPKMTESPPLYSNSPHLRCYLSYVPLIDKFFPCLTLGRVLPLCLSLCSVYFYSGRIEFRMSPLFSRSWETALEITCK